MTCLSGVEQFFLDIFLDVFSVGSNLCSVSDREAIFQRLHQTRLSDSFTLGYMKLLGTLTFSTKTLCHFVQTFKEQVKVAKSVSTTEQEGLSDQDQSILYYIWGFNIRRLSKRYQTKCLSKRQCIQRLKLKTPNSTFVSRSIGRRRVTVGGSLHRVMNCSYWLGNSRLSWENLSTLTTYLQHRYSVTDWKSPYSSATW